MGFKNILVLIGFLMLGFLAPRSAFAHCEIPCGIYDDESRFVQVEEDIATIEKSMKQINELSAAEEKNFNQLTRWVNNKETHADKIKETVATYFLSQRIKLPKNQEDQAAYYKQLSLLHRITVFAMKAKQTTDLTYVEKLKNNTAAFKTLFDELHGHAH